MASKAQPTNALPELPAKFEALETILNSELVERRTEIRAAMIALVAGHHVFFLGPPGVAKSLLVKRLHAYIGGARKFQKLMTRFTVPEEIFGPHSIKAMKEDRFERKIDKYLPTVELAFIDEIFKSNSSILNALLEALNERTYEHGSTVINLPLSSAFSASNELPQDEGLNALYDRFLFRFEVKPIRDNSNFKRMLTTTLDKNPQPLLDWAEVELAKAEAAKVEIPDAVMDALTDIKVALKEAGIEPTDRRFEQCLSVIRATAWLDGETVADVEHLRPLRNIMWERPEQQGQVDSIVLAVANPLDSKAAELLDEIIRLEDKLDRISKLEAVEKNRQGVELHQKLKRGKTELDDLMARAGNRRRESEVMTECKERLHAAVNRLLTNVFGIDGPHADKIGE